MKFLQLIFTALVVAYANADVSFNINNKFDGPIWIGTAGNAGLAPLLNGGFKMAAGESRTITSDDNWGGRFWARTWCNDDTNHCLTGDCGNGVECNGATGVPPATLIEITLKGNDGLDNYDISFVDGYNGEASIEPINGVSDDSKFSCLKAQCGTNIDDICPAELQVKSDDGTLIACNSACNAFHTDEYCCAGEHNTEPTCKSSDWPVNYPAIFKQACPDAYSYAYDDNKSLFTCKASEYTLNFGGV